MYNPPPFLLELLRQRQHLAAGGPVLGTGAGYNSVPHGLGTPSHAGGRQPVYMGAPGAGGAPAYGIEGAQAFSVPGPQSGFQAKAPMSDQQFSPGLYQPTVAQGQGSLSTVTNALTSQMNGGGPNLADAELRQATDRNISQQYAMAQANPNDAGALRNLASNVGNVNQEAAGQAAMLRMQQQFAAQHQLGQMGLGELGTGGSLMTDQQKLGLEQSQGNQNAAISAQGQNLTSSLANQQAALPYQTAGLSSLAGLVNGASAAAAHAAGGGSSPGAQTATDPTTGDGFTYGDPATISDPAAPIDTGSIPIPDGVSYAHGGLVHSLMARHFASGGSVPYNYELPTQVGDPKAPNLLHGAQAIPGAPSGSPTGGSPSGGGSSGSDTYIDSLKAKQSADPKNPNALTPAERNAVQLYDMQHSTGNGVYKAALSPATHAILNTVAPGVGGLIASGIDLVGDPANQQAIGNWVSGAADSVGNKAGDIFNTAFGWMAEGGPVPGRAQSSGDSADNDTVPAMLSPGEVVLPRSVSQSDDAPDKARAFMEAVEKSKAPKPSFKDVLESHRQLHQRLSQLESRMRGAK